MRTALPQQLLAYLLLAAFGLAQIVCASAGVRCTDSSGESRIEIACVKTSLGHCRTACGPDARAIDDGNGCGDRCGQPAPCSDEPIGGQIGGAKLLPSRDSMGSVLIPVCGVVCGDFRPERPADPIFRQRTGSDRGRPPDEIVRLRTVVLVV